MTAATTERAGAAAGGLVTFRLGDRHYATPLDHVREVVRLQGLVVLPGMRPPLAGVLDLRGAALPVLDLRCGEATAVGDVLVLDRAGAADRGLAPGTPDRGTAPAGDPVGIAVDEVRAVVGADDLVPAGGATGTGVLPSYVVAVLRGPDGVVFLVDLEAMVAAASPPQT